MSVFSLVAAFIIGAAQGLPPDVPKNHWAYPAVNKLFEEGLLKGYPARSQPKLILEKSAKFDLVQMQAWKDKWLAKGFAVEYPESPYRRDYGNASRYEFAVMVHAVWSGVKDILTKTDQASTLQAAALGEVGNLAQAISVFDYELTKLGANPKQMIARLNDLQDSGHKLFHGNR